MIAPMQIGEVRQTRRALIGYGDDGWVTIPAEEKIIIWDMGKATCLVNHYGNKYGCVIAEVIDQSYKIQDAPDQETR